MDKWTIILPAHLSPQVICQAHYLQSVHDEVNFSKALQCEYYTFTPLLVAAND